MAIEYRSLQPSTTTSNVLQLKKNPVAVCCNCHVGLADAVLQSAGNVCRFSTVSTHHLPSPWFHIHSLCSHNTTRKSFVGGEKNSNGIRGKSCCSVFQAEDTTPHTGDSKVCNY